MAELTKGRARLDAELPSLLTADEPHFWVRVDLVVEFQQVVVGRGYAHIPLARMFEH